MPIIIGSVAVDVVPSAASFAPKVDAAISPAIKDITRKIASQISDSIVQGFRDGSAKARSSATQGGSSSGGAFADAFKARVTAALKDLPNPKVGLDATELDAELADIRERLAALGDVRVGVDLSAEAATAELDALKARLDELGARSPNIDVKIDTARASAELAAIQAEVDHLDGQDATVDVNVDDHGSASEATAGVSGLTAAILGVGPALIPLAGAAVVGLGGIATAAGAALGGVGVLALAFSGVSKAVGLLGQEHTAAAAQSATSARTEATSAAAIVSAQQQVKSATEGLAQARANAANAAISSAESVKNAEQSLANAQRTAATQEIAAAQAVTAAQTALNAAREQAARDLEAASNSAADSILSQQQAVIDLANAQATNQAVQASSTSTDLQKQQAALDLAKAQQALTESNQQVTQSAEDNNKAQADGVSGAPAVVAARQSLTKAEAARAAQQRSDAQSVAKAQQALADAIRAQATQQRTSAFSITQAQQSVASAMRAVQTASASAGASGSTALSKIHSQLALLSPATLQFARFVTGTLEPVFRHLQGVAAGGLLPGVEAAIKSVSPLLAPFTSFVGSLAKTMGSLAAQAGRALTDPFWIQFFSYVASTAGPTLVTMVHILEDLGKGFAGLLVAFSPVVTRLGAGILDLSGKFAHFGTNVAPRSPLQQFLRWVTQTGPLVWSTLEAVGSAVGHIVVALAPFGVHLLEGISGLADAVSALPPAVIEAIALAIVGVVLAVKALAIAGKALKLVFVEVDGVLAANPFGLVALAIAGLVVGFIVLYDHCKTFRDFIQDKLMPVLRTIGDDVMAGVKDAIHEIGQAIDNNRPALTQMYDDFKSLADLIVTKVLPVLGPLFKLALKGIGDEIGVTVDAITLLWKGFIIGVNQGIDVINAFIRILDKVLGPFNIHINTLDHVSATASASPHGAAGHGQRVSAAASGAVLGFAPIGPGFVTNGPRAVVGEGNPNHPEYVIPTDPAHRDRAMTLYQSLGAQLLQGGGVLGALGSLVGDATGFARHLAADGAGKALSVAEAPVRAILDRLPHTFIHSMVASVLNKINASVEKSIAGAAGAGGFGGSTVGGAGELAVWKNLRSVGMSAAQAAGVMGNMQTESGFNPFIIQGGGTSLNPAAAGGGGYGLVQWTPGSKLIPYLHGAVPSVASEVAALAAQLSGQGPSPESAAGAALRGTSTPSAAADVFGLMYERYAGGLQTARSDQADAIFAKFHSFDRGGSLDPGYTLAYNGTGMTEAVAPRQSFAELMSGSSGGSSFDGDITVYAQFGDEPVEAIATRVVKDRAARVATTERKAR